MFDDAPVKDLFDRDKGATKVGNYGVRDGITDAGLQHFQDTYKGQQICLGVF